MTVVIEHTFISVQTAIGKGGNAFFGTYKRFCQEFSPRRTMRLYYSMPFVLLFDQSEIFSFFLLVIILHMLQKQCDYIIYCPKKPLRAKM